MLASILALAVQIVGWLIQRAAVRAESAKAFYEWAEMLGSDLGSSRLREYGAAQLDWFTKNPWKETK